MLLHRTSSKLSRQRERWTKVSFPTLQSCGSPRLESSQSWQKTLLTCWQNMP